MIKPTFTLTLGLFTLLAQAQMTPVGLWRSIDAVDVTQGQTAYRIVIPWIDSVTIKSRILLRETGKTDRTLELTGVVDPDLRRMELHIEALEVTA